MILIWFGIILIGTVGVVLFVLQQQGKIFTGSHRQELPSLHRTVFNLQIGDIVQYMGTDWVVEGHLTYNVKDFTWSEYMLQDGDRINWLSVEEDDLVEVALLEPTNQLDISETPPKQLNFAGETFRRVDSGTARMTRKGTIKKPTASRCKYFDYQGSNNRVLSIEIWDGEVEVTVGELINPKSLLILPGDGKRVYEI
ncbi:hypothetical protein NUACC21_32450 [Scytonema sp. NUACC21]